MKKRATWLSTLILFILVSQIGLLQTTTHFGRDSVTLSEPGRRACNGESERTELLGAKFYENMGQANHRDVAFYADLDWGMIGFGASMVLLTSKTDGRAIRITFVDAYNVCPRGEEELPHRVNYFLGSRGTFTGGRVFKRIVYDNLWNGISLVYDSAPGGVKYEFHLAPYANSSLIRIRCKGHSSLDVDEESISLVGCGLSIVDTGLNVTQGNSRVNARFVQLNSEAFGFDLEDYDEAEELIIDPLIYSTYIGGGGEDFPTAVTRGPDGMVYLVGVTSSSDFPSKNPFASTNSGNLDCFVMCYNETSNMPVFCTYVGGSNADGALDVVVTEEGVYVTGYTYSDDFPIVDPYRMRPYHGQADCFLLKMTLEGDSLIFSNYRGGSDNDVGAALVVIGNDVYVAVNTASSDILAYGGFDTSHNGGWDCYIVELENDDSRDYETFIGGSQDDIVTSIFVDLQRNVYLVGYTQSDDFPTANAYDDTFNGGVDCFVSKLDSSGGSLAFSTYFGGALDDYATGIVLDSAKNIYVTGDTSSTGIPLMNALDETHNGGSDCIVFKLDPTGTTLEYSTFIGGGSDDLANAILVDTYGTVSVTGRTGSEDFPTEKALDGFLNGSSDCFLFELDTRFFNLQYSSYLGGNGEDGGLDILYGSTENTYVVAGYTNSTDFPIQTPISGFFEGGLSDCFLTEIGLVDEIPIVTPGDPMFVTVGVLALVAPPGLYLVRRRLKSRFSASAPAVALAPAPSVMQEEVPTPETPHIEILRGCEVVGGKFEYKVKVVNKSKFVVNNVAISIVAYPKDCMELLGDSVRSIKRIEPNGFRSPQFTFLPTKDCVEGNILASVSYVNHMNQLQTSEVESYTIRSVCDLLVPLKASVERFQGIIDDMTSTSTETSLNWNVQVMFSKARALLPQRNFHVVYFEENVVGDQFTGIVKGFAEGKYSGKKVAVQTLMTGKLHGEETRVVVEVLGDDIAMLPTTVEEITREIGSWTCLNCRAPLEPADVIKLKGRLPVTCRSCGHTVTVDLFRS